MKQINVEIIKEFKGYWHKILKYFIVVTLLSNGLCVLLGYWSWSFLYFSTFIIFSVIFMLFMVFYNAGVTIHDSDY